MGARGIGCDAEAVADMRQGTHLRIGAAGQAVLIKKARRGRAAYGLREAAGQKSRGINNQVGTIERYITRDGQARETGKTAWAAMPGNSSTAAATKIATRDLRVRSQVAPGTFRRFLL